MKNRIYSVCEAAQYAKVSDRTIRRWIFLGLPAFRSGPKLLRIDESHLDEWIFRNRVNVCPPKST